MNNLNKKDCRHSYSRQKRDSKVRKSEFLMVSSSKQKKKKTNKPKKQKDDPYFLQGNTRGRQKTRNLQSKHKKKTSDIFELQIRSSVEESSTIKDIVRTSGNYPNALCYQKQPHTVRNVPSPQICKIYFERQYEQKDVYMTPPKKYNQAPTTDVMNPEIQLMTVRSLDAAKFRKKNYLTGKQKRRLDKLKKLQKILSSQNMERLPSLMKKLVQSLD